MDRGCPSFVGGVSFFLVGFFLVRWGPYYYIVVVVTVATTVSSWPPYQEYPLVAVAAAAAAAAAHICLRRARFLLGVTVDTTAVSKIILLILFMPTLSSYNLFSITWRSLFHNATRGGGLFPSTAE